MSLSSQQAEAPGPSDRLSGPPERAPIILYADFECPRCALAYVRLRDAGANLGIRHFPVKSKHPLSFGAAAATEAAAHHNLFWEMVDSLFTDQGRLDQPDLWRRAVSLGIDLEEFEQVRNSDAVRQAIEESFRSAIRAGVASTPTILVDGKLIADVPSADECAVLACRPAG